MGPRSDFSKPCQGAAEKSANATRCCCLARGFQRVGMSTVEAVNRKISWLFCFVSHGCTVSARSVLSMSDDVGRCIALQSVPFFASGEQGQAELCLHFRVGILQQFQKSRHGDGGLATDLLRDFLRREALLVELPKIRRESSTCTESGTSI